MIKVELKVHRHQTYSHKLYLNKYIRNLFKGELERECYIFYKLYKDDVYFFPVSKDYEFPKIEDTYIKTDDDCEVPIDIGKIKLQAFGPRGVALHLKKIICKQFPEFFNKTSQTITIRCDFNFNIFYFNYNENLRILNEKT